MNKYLRKFGFRSSDDLEMKITIKAIKWSWLYVMFFLAIWSLLGAIDSGEIPFIQIVLIITGELLYLILQWIFTKKEVRKGEKSHYGSQRIKSEKKGKYEYVYEDEDGTQYIYEEVDDNEE